MIYIIFYIIAWIVGFIVYFSKKSGSLIQSLVISHLVICVGLFGIWNFFGHFFMAEKIAQSIGWISNEFQKELAFVSLGIGIAGILCLWFKNGFWWATIIPYTTFLFGAAGIHIFEMIEKGNFKPENSLIIIPDILMPLTIIILLILNSRLKKKFI